MGNMPKYKVEHYEDKIKRHFDPLIEEQELLVKQFKTDATKRIVGKLSKKMGADKILNQFKKAEDMIKKAQQDAKTFFQKKAKQDEKKTVIYNIRERDEITLSDCEEQLREWAKSLVDRELRKRKEGCKGSVRGICKGSLQCKTLLTFQYSVLAKRFRLGVRETIVT